MQIRQVCPLRLQVFDEFLTGGIQSTIKLKTDKLIDLYYLRFISILRLSILIGFTKKHYNLILFHFCQRFFFTIMPSSVPLQFTRLQCFIL